MKSRTTVNAFIAGMGSAFALFPAGNVARCVNSATIAYRMNGNFSRVGKSLYASIGQLKDATGLSPTIDASKETIGSIRGGWRSGDPYQSS